MTKILNIVNVTKTFNSGKVKALKAVSFAISSGEIISIVGESGSGKTTLIRLIAGLETPDDGVIELDSCVVSSLNVFLPPEKRNVGLVFQDYALFPHLTVFKNIAYGISKIQNKKERVAEVLDLVGLDDLEKRYPHELSGGQQQRVALARALAPNPQLIILDEPFSNLDIILRNKLRNDITAIIKKTGTTAIFITHDIKDAFLVSDKILVLQNGNLIQEDTPDILKNSPKTDYVKLLLEAASL